MKLRQIGRIGMVQHDRGQGRGQGQGDRAKFPRSASDRRDPVGTGRL